MYSFQDGRLLISLPGCRATLDVKKKEILKAVIYTKIDTVFKESNYKHIFITLLLANLCLTLLN